MAAPDRHEFSRAIVADGGPYTLEGWVRPDADLDDRFTMMLDDGEFIRVNGWLFSVEDTD